MTDDAVQSAPPPIDPVPAPEPTPPPVESTPVLEQTAPAEPAFVIQEESQSVPESMVEPPEVEVSAPESQPAPSSAQATSSHQTLAAQSSPRAQSPKWSAAERARAVAKHVGNKEARLAKVVELAKEKGRITNDDIEKLLHVSDATASRYGTILVQRVLLKREGKGRGAFYILAL